MRPCPEEHNKAEHRQNAHISFVSNWAHSQWSHPLPPIVGFCLYVFVFVFSIRTEMPHPTQELPSWWPSFLSLVLTIHPLALWPPILYIPPEPLTKGQGTKPGWDT